ncbi:lipoprotein [Rhodococcus rhodochrous]|uniref:hypothetical protein n=1 Tax=Rhodococcus rhodochrous TaxID=1829 RepID=UPI000A6EB6A4|nr:hypothetical protein [Rhodococcus rhodochrous]SNV27080.1 lipoprotein [Rhodococcus rhodochrous]
MRSVDPYLRVLAGMFAGVVVWLAIVEVLHGEFGQAVFSLLIAAGLAYLAVGKPLREYRRRVQAEQAAIVARAEAGHRAYLAGDLRSAMAPPPEPPKPPRLRRGVVIAAVLAAMFVLFGIINDISDGLESPSEGEASTTPQSSGHSAAAHSATQSGTTAATTARTASPAAAPSPRPSVTAASYGRAAVMPDVGCMDLQAAQDLIQSDGVFYSTSVDATGRGGRRCGIAIG